MKSGWIIKFKDGYKCALTEEKYKSWSERNTKDEIEVEQHWFDIERGYRENNIERIFE